MNPQEIDSNFQTLPSAIFTSTFKPLGWPKVIFAQKRLSRKSKKPSFFETLKITETLTYEASGRFSKFGEATQNGPRSSPEGDPRSTTDSNCEQRSSALYTML